MNSSKRKGSRVEYELRDKLKSLGLLAERIVGSGAYGKRLSGDLDDDVLSNHSVLKRWECKARKRFATLAKWFGQGEADALYLRADGDTDGFVVMRFSKFAELLQSDVTLES